MRVRLTHPDRELDLGAPTAPGVPSLVQDLELEAVLEAMGGKDPFLTTVARKVLLEGLTDVQAIRYRQEVLWDCLQHPATIRALYALACEGLDRERKEYAGVFGNTPESLLRRSVRILEAFLGILRRLRELALDGGGEFASMGFRRLFATLTDELDEEYLAHLEAQLKRLRFPGGILVSAGLGRGNRGTAYVLHGQEMPKRLRWLAGLKRRKDSYSFDIRPRDELGILTLAELRSRGVNPVAAATAQSMEHILGFFRQLQGQLAFYLGCLALKERLQEKGRPICFPNPQPEGGPRFAARGLYDVGLALRTEAEVVGNDVEADGRRLVVITGANRGGKSTFLRGVGLAQLMMQAGMYVAANEFSADVRSGLFTHFRREEDAAMRSGRLEAELVQMEAVVDQIRPRALLLCNESFSSTTEHEGSQIAREIVRALTEAGVKVFYVTHLYSLASEFTRESPESTLFLRAERGAGGQRTYRLLEGEPLPTSFGRDLYLEILGEMAGP